MKIKNLILLFFLLYFITAANGQQTNDMVKSIGAKLVKNETTISKVLSDPSFLPLHSLTAFREVIEKNARPGKIQLNTDNEPGTRITIKGIVKDKAGKPPAEKLVYVYQTSSEGWYSDTAPHILQREGDRRHARLFGYFKTDLNGGFEFNTVKPKGYPNSTLPAHIHIEIYLGEDKALISELQFDDDPRLTGDTRNRSVEEGFLIVKNSGTNNDPIYFYNIQIPD